jgi:hypothetical protein
MKIAVLPTTTGLRPKAWVCRTRYPQECPCRCSPQLCLTASTFFTNQKLNLNPLSILLAESAAVACPKNGEVCTPVKLIRFVRFRTL